MPMSFVDLKMFTNGFDYVIAENIQEAKNILSQEYYGDVYSKLKKKQKEDFDSFKWEEKDTSEIFTLYEELSGGTSKTIEEWIREEGKGFFASSEL
jgi:hypothetical protein